MRRRSLYKRIEHPDVRKEAEILDIRTVDAPLELKAQAVGLAQALRGYNLLKPPSIDEIVQYSAALPPALRAAAAGPDTTAHARTLGPGDAINAGSTYLVVGRPILAAPDPRAAAEAIGAEVRQALSR